MINLGWTRDQVLDQVDIPFLQTLRQSWEDYPPVRMLLAAMIGHKPKQRGNIADLLEMFPDGVIKG